MAGLEKLDTQVNVRMSRELIARLESRVTQKQRQSDIIREALEKYLDWLDSQDAESKKKVISFTLVGR